MSFSPLKIKINQWINRLIYKKRFKKRSNIILNNGIQLEESAKGEYTECTIKRQRNKGAIYWKMTIDKR